MRHRSRACARQLKAKPARLFWRGRSALAFCPGGTAPPLGSRLLPGLKNQLVRGKVGFTHEVSAGKRLVRRNASFTHGVGAGKRLVRRKAGFTHGVGAGKRLVRRNAGFTHEVGVER